MARILNASAFAALFLVVGCASSVSPPTQAQDKPEEGNWREVPGDMAFLPPGAEARCGHAQGCVIFTVPGLRETLSRANGTCGRVDPPAKEEGRRI